MSQEFHIFEDAQGSRDLYRKLAATLSEFQKARLDNLLKSAWIEGMAFRNEGRDPEGMTFEGIKVGA